MRFSSLLFSSLLSLVVFASCSEGELTQSIVPSPSAVQQKNNKLVLNEQEANILLATVVSVGPTDPREDIRQFVKSRKITFDLTKSYITKNDNTGMYFVVFPTLNNQGSGVSYDLVYMLTNAWTRNSPVSVAGGFFLKEEFVNNSFDQSKVHLLTVTGSVIREAQYDYTKEILFNVSAGAETTTKGWWSDFTDCLGEYWDVADSNPVYTAGCVAAGPLCATVGVGGCAGWAVSQNAAYTCCDNGATPLPGMNF